MYGIAFKVAVQPVRSQWCERIGCFYVRGIFMEIAKSFIQYILDVFMHFFVTEFYIGIFYVLAVLLVVLFIRWIFTSL